MSQLINPHTGKPVRKDGFVYYVEGSTGTGKTELIKKIVNQIPLKRTGIDFSGEYKKLGIKTTPLGSANPKKVGLHLIAQLQNVWESVIILSEMGEYVSNQGDLNPSAKFVLKEARKRGNWIFGDFHKLSEININALGVGDILYMKRSTGETLPQLKKFFHYIEIEQGYREVMKDQTHVNVNGRTYWIGTRKIDLKNLTLKNSI